MKFGWTIIPLLIIGLAILSMPTVEGQWVSVAIHSTVEAVGATIAILLGCYLLLGLNKDNTWSFPFLGLGFIGMGIFDIFHSMTGPSDSFVFLHSLAGIAGGLGFLSVLLPKWLQNKGKSLASVFLCLAICFAFSLWALNYPNTLPQMHVGMSFSPAAIYLNLLQAFLFLFPLWWFYKERHHLGLTRTYAFLLMGALFSFSGFTFAFSQLWSTSWWLWHLLRLLAYVVALYIIGHANYELHLQVARDKRALEKSNEELDAFAYTASHDLKEPLRGIHNYAQFVLEDYGEVLGDDGKAKLETMCRLSNRLDGLIESLLRFSRLGRQKLVKKDVSAKDIVDGALDSLATAISEKEATVEVAPDLPEVYCDSTLLTQVFQNLVANGLKYNDQKPEIKIACNQTDGQAVFTVEDNGIGIREKHLDAVFKLFKRLNSRKKYGDGLGSGLTLSKKIIERHGGQIWLQSQYGEGTSFYFTLGKKQKA